MIFWVVTQYNVRIQLLITFSDLYLCKFYSFISEVSRATSQQTSHSSVGRKAWTFFFKKTTPVKLSLITGFIVTECPEAQETTTSLPSLYLFIPLLLNALRSLFFFFKPLRIFNWTKSQDTSNEITRFQYVPVFPLIIGYNETFPGANMFEYFKELHELKVPGREKRFGSYLIGMYRVSFLLAVKKNSLLLQAAKSF